MIAQIIDNINNKFAVGEMMYMALNDGEWKVRSEKVTVIASDNLPRSTTCFPTFISTVEADCWEYVRARLTEEKFIIDEKLKSVNAKLEVLYETK